MYPYTKIKISIAKKNLSSSKRDRLLCNGQISRSMVIKSDERNRVTKKSGKCKSRYNSTKNFDCHRRIPMIEQYFLKQDTVATRF